MEEEAALRFARLLMLQLLTKARLLVSLCQVVACLPLVLNLTFPPSFQGLTHLLGMLALVPFGLECLGAFDYVDYLLGVTILSCAVLAVLWVCFKRFEIEAAVRSACGTEAEAAPEVSPRTRTQWRASVASAAHVFVFLVLPGLSCAIFRMFPCQVRPECLLAFSRMLLLPY